jgi:hypothetical protein
MGLLRRPLRAKSWKTDDWAGPAGRARIRAQSEKTNLRLRRHSTSKLRHILLHIDGATSSLAVVREHTLCPANHGMQPTTRAPSSSDGGLVMG